MKIVYCLQALHRRGGIERVITTKANYLASHGYEVHIVTTDQRSEPIAFELDERVKLHDLALNYELDNDLGRWRRLKAMLEKRPEHRAKLSTLLSEIKPDVTISTGFHEASLLPQLHDGSRKVLEMHTSRSAREYMYPEGESLMRLYGRLRTWADERLARKYDAFVILTEAERPLYRHQHNIHVIPNACLLSNASPSPLEHKQAIAAGRLEYVKNFESLIRIWSLVHKAQPEWQLAIYGEGPLRASLQEQINNQGLQDVVTLHRATERLEECYRQSSLYLMTSHFEGLPMVLLEAQTMGLPIVAYSAPSGPREVVHSGVDGLLLPEGAEELFARELIALMENKERMQAMGREALKASERYQIEPVMTLWQELFAKLANK